MTVAPQQIPTRTPHPAETFDPAHERAWLLELMASPLWNELSDLQQQRWLHQLDLLSRPRD